MGGDAVKLLMGSWLLAGVLLLGGCRDGKEDHSDAAVRPLTAVMDLDSLNIEAFCAAGTPAILEFGGKRCISCMQMRENLRELRGKRRELRVGYVYWEDSPELFERWDIGLIPVQVILDAEGRERARHIGVWEVEEMQEALTAALPRGQ